MPRNTGANRRRGLASRTTEFTLPEYAAVKIAAARAGLSVRRWLKRVILLAALPGARGPNPTPKE